MNDEEYNEYIDELRLHGTRELAEEVYKLEKENKKLKNIINELEKWLNEQENFTTYPNLIFVGSIQYKLKKLKGE